LLASAPLRTIRLALLFLLVYCVFELGMHLDLRHGKWQTNVGEVNWGLLMAVTLLLLGLVAFAIAEEVRFRADRIYGSEQPASTDRVAAGVAKKDDDVATAAAGAAASSNERRTARQIARQLAASRGP